MFLNQQIANNTESRGNKNPSKPFFFPGTEDKQHQIYQDLTPQAYQRDYLQRHEQHEQLEQQDTPSINNTLQDQTNWNSHDAYGSQFAPPPESFNNSYTTIFSHGNIPVRKKDHRGYSFYENDDRVLDFEEETKPLPQALQFMKQHKSAKSNASSSPYSNTNGSLFDTFTLVGTPSTVTPTTLDLNAGTISFNRATNSGEAVKKMFFDEKPINDLGFSEQLPPFIMPIGNVSDDSVASGDSFSTSNDSTKLTNDNYKRTAIASTKSYYRTFKVIIFLALLMFIPPVLLGLVSTSCRKDSGYCIPRFEFQFIDDSPTSQLNAPRELIKVVAYYAMNSITSQTNGRFSDDDIEVIDTFSTENAFRLNYFGYCKLNYLSNVETCESYNYGMDLGSVLVKDAGMSLGSISDADNPETVSDSIVSAYHDVLDSMGDQNNVAYEAVLVKYLGGLLPYVCLVSFVCCTVALVYAVIMSCLLSSKLKFNGLQRRLTMLLTVLNVINFFSLFVNLVDLGVELLYILKLDEFCLDKDIAYVNFGLGFFIHVAVAFVQLVIALGLTALIYFSPWTALKSFNGNDSML